MGKRQRVALAFAPSVVGLFLVAALAYWGAFERRVPTLVLIAGVIATLIAMGIGVWIARQVDPANAEAALQAVGDAAYREVAGARAQTDEHRTMLEQIVTSMSCRVRDVQLPLHILLDTPFGTLNENQEELLGVARQSAEAADGELRLLRRLLQEPADVSSDTEAISVGELLAPALAVAASVAEAALVRLVVDVPPELPPVRVPVVAIQESLATVLLELLATLPGGADLELHARAEADMVTLRLVPPLNTDAPSFRLRLAIRLLQRHAAWSGDLPWGCTVRLPATDVIRRAG